MASVASNSSEQQMEIDGQDSGSNLIDLLKSYDIYDDTFPLEVRVELEPIIKEFKLYEYTLDIHSAEEEVVRHVNNICAEVLGRLNRRLQEVSSMSSEYLVVNKISLFMNEIGKNNHREFFVRLFSKLELEKQLRQSDHTFKEYRRQVNENFKILNTHLTSMIQSRSEQIDTLNRLDNFLRNLSFNRDVMNRNARRQVPDNSDTNMKVNLQKSQYLSECSKFKTGLMNDLKMQEEGISRLPELVRSFTQVCGQGLTKMRIHNPRFLSLFLSSLKEMFSTIRANLSKLERIISAYDDKLQNECRAHIHDQSLLGIPKPDLEPLHQSQRVLIQNALVISEEPSFSSRCLKRDKKLTSYELLLLLRGANVCDHCLEANLLTESGLRHIREDLVSYQSPIISDNDRGGQFKGGVATMEHDVQREITKFAFKDLTITAASRKHKQNQAVTQQKHVIMFSGQVTVDNKAVNIHCFTLPVIVAVHGNQTSKSLAAIFWDDNFAKEDRTGLEVNGFVSWADMADALRNLFRRELQREPTELNLRYLKDRLYGDVPHEDGITFEMFAKINNKTAKLSFWEWLWGTIQLLDGDPKLLQLWRDGYIVGYISQTDAKVFVKKCQQLPSDGPGPNNEKERLFLIRFSESQKELITIQGYLFDPNKGWGIFSVNPYRAADLKAIPLSTRILDRADCQILLYECSTTNCWLKRQKDSVFTREVSDEDNTSLPYGYISWALKERTDDACTDLSNFRVDTNDVDGAFSPFSFTDAILDEPLPGENVDLIQWISETQCPENNDEL